MNVAPNTKVGCRFKTAKLQKQYFIGIFNKEYENFIIWNNANSKIIHVKNVDYMKNVYYICMAGIYVNL